MKNESRAVFAVDESNAKRLDYYHEYIKSLCDESEFKCHTLDDKPKHASVSGDYHCWAENVFFHEKAVVGCRASLGFTDEGNYCMVLDYHRANGDLIANKSRRIKLEKEGIDMICWWFKDGVMQLDNMGCMWGSWGEGNKVDSAYPDRALYSTQMLEIVVIPKMLIKNGINFEGIISKVAVIAGEIPFDVRTGCDSKIELEFLLNGTRTRGSIMISDFIKEMGVDENYKKTSDGYGVNFMINDSIKMGSWESLYAKQPTNSLL